MPWWATKCVLCDYRESSRKGQSLPSNRTKDADGSRWGPNKGSHSVFCVRRYCASHLCADLSLNSALSKFLHLERAHPVNSPFSASPAPGRHSLGATLSLSTGRTGAPLWPQPGWELPANGHQAPSLPNPQCPTGAWHMLTLSGTCCTFVKGN